jgi:hypothetical protein
MTSSTRAVDWKGRRRSTGGSKVSYAAAPIVTVLSKNMKISKLRRSCSRTDGQPQVDKQEFKSLRLEATSISVVKTSSG